MKYNDLKKAFQELKCSFPKEDMTAHIVFTKDSFDKSYSLLSRTYSFSSNNKAFWSHMGSHSIFAYCLDSTDQGVRLDWYMAEEGNPDGWTVEDCYILEQMQDAAAIPSADGTEQNNGIVSYYFGDTCIRAYETVENDEVKLTPLSGN